MSGDRLLFVGRLPHYLASVLCVEGGRRVGAPARRALEDYDITRPFAVEMVK